MKKFLITIAPFFLILLFFLWFILGIEAIKIFFEVALLGIVFVTLISKLITKWVEFVNKHIKED